MTVHDALRTRNEYHRNRNGRGRVRRCASRAGIARRLLSLSLVLSLVVPGVSPAFATGESSTTRPAPAEQRLASGDGHTLQIRGDGTLWAWGWNDKGQLGLGDTFDRMFPTRVGTDSDWMTVAAGGPGHSLGIKSDGTLWSWGWNYSGQLGLGDTVDRLAPVQLGNRTDWVSVSAGEYHSLAVRSDGTLWAWGYNLQGELGDNSMSQRNSPVQVGGTGWKSAVCGSFYSIGIKSDGTLWAWGNNGSGRLGLGDTSQRLVPTQVAGTGWSSAAVGDGHTLAIKSDGSLWSWGSNGNGQLGLGDTAERHVPTQVAGTGWRSVATGLRHTLATKSDGTLWAWGLNYVGNLGVGDLNDRWAPTQVGSATSWISAAAGANRSAALRSDGTVWVWGNNLGTGHYLGIGVAEPRVTSPRQIVPAADWVQVDGGGFHTLAVRANGTLWSWGVGGSQGSPLGHGDQAMRTKPTQVGSATDWAQVSAGESFSVAVKTDGTLWAWGTNYFGQFGNGESGSAANSTAPVKVGTDKDWMAVEAGAWHTLALKSDGTLWTTGRNNSNQLGLGDTANRSTFTQVGSDTDWVQVSAGHSHSLARKADGSLWSWGANYYGEGGQPVVPSATGAPTRIGVGSDWETVYAGGFHTLGIKTDGTLWSWGYNDRGQTGTGFGGSTLRQVGSDDDWASVAAGDFFSVASKTDGSAWGWGFNAAGMVGDGSGAQQNTPVQVAGAQDYAEVFAGMQFALGVKADGSLWAWGDNQAGALGDGTQTQRDVPTFSANGRAAGTGSVAPATAAGATHSLSIKSDGTLWAWGSNAYGKLGLGDKVTRSLPTRVGSENDWVAVSAGQNFSVAIKSDGTLWAWGLNDQGQLGLGETYEFLSPTQVGVATDWAWVSAGNSHTLALKGDGTLWAWGNGGMGRLGLGDVDDRRTPAQVGDATDWKSVSAGGVHSLAIKNDGTLWAWGYNFHGSLGLGDADDRLIPTRIGSGTDWAEATTGAFHSLARKSDGTLWTWGFNDSGQLGLGDEANRYVPVKVGEDGGWSSVSASRYYTLATQSDGTLWAWGLNDRGQLGLDGVEGLAAPAQVGDSTDWASVAVGYGHTLASRSDGTLWACGGNEDGQLGTGDALDDYALARAFAPGDVVTPTLLAVRSATHPISGRAGSADFSAVVSGVDSESAVLGFSWTIDQSPGTVPDDTLDSYGAVTTPEASELAPGTWYLHVRAADFGLNWSETTHFEFSANSAPVAEDDEYATDYETELVVAAGEGVLENDTDPDRDVLSAALSTVTSNGMLALDTDGGFAYTPDEGFVGEDTFTYRAFDGVEYSDTATVTITVHAADPPPDPVIPVAGDDRYLTAVKTSELAFPGGAKTVVIATGENWPDALGGTSLAGALDGPVLLVKKGSVPSAVMKEIRRLEASKAIILGGEGAVSASVEGALKTELGSTKVRRVWGTDRYKTANAIAREVIKAQGAGFDGYAFVATGADFPDALAAAPLAAAKGWPLYLADPKSGLSDATKSAMDGVEKTLILGGTAVVSPETQTYLNGRFGKGDVKRLAGGDRYETAAVIAAYAVKSHGHGWDRVGVTTGENFPDALAGGVLQGKEGSVMLLTRSKALSAPARDALTLNKGDISTVTFFGGDNAVSPAVRTAVGNALK